MTDFRAIAVVTARGGSKRIPHKNIREMLGIPLISRAIAILRAAGQFDRIVVSTDDDEIARIAVAAGAEVPFRRPRELADDHAGTLAVMSHAVTALQRHGWSAPLVACVYPAAVFVAPDDYEKAMRRMATDDGIDYVFTATEYRHPPQRALRLLPAGGCEMIYPEFAATRSQGLEVAFHDAGQFYVGRTQAWLDERPLHSERSRVHLLPHQQVQDIDTLDDWARAEAILQFRGESGSAAVGVPPQVSPSHPTTSNGASHELRLEG